MSLLWLCGKFSLWFGSSSPHFKVVPEGAAPQPDYCFLRHYRTSEIPDLLCSAHSVPRRRLWPLSFTWVHGGTLPNLKPGLHVPQSRKPLQYLVAKTDKLSFSGQLLKTWLVWKRRLWEAPCVWLWCSNTFSVADMFNSLLDEITLDLFGTAS